MLDDATLDIGSVSFLSQRNIQLFFSSSSSPLIRNQKKNGSYYYYRLQIVKSKSKSKSTFSQNLSLISLSPRFSPKPLPFSLSLRIFPENFTISALYSQLFFLIDFFSLFVSGNSLRIGFVNLGEILRYI